MFGHLTIVSFTINIVVANMICKSLTQFNIDNGEQWTDQHELIGGPINSYLLQNVYFYQNIELVAIMAKQGRKYYTLCGKPFPDCTSETLIPFIRVREKLNTGGFVINIDYVKLRIDEEETIACGVVMDYPQIIHLNETTVTFSGNIRILESHRNVSDYKEIQLRYEQIRNSFFLQYFCFPMNITLFSSRVNMEAPTATGTNRPVNKQTTPNQFESIVDFMVEHPQLARGYIKTADARQKSNNLWERLVEKLNAEGPPVKDVHAWKKVWADFKTHIKAKLRKEQQSIGGTGGGKPLKIVFTPLEEKILEVLQLRKSVTGTINTKHFGVVEIEEVITNPILLSTTYTNTVDLNYEEDTAESIDIPPTPRPTTSRYSSRQSSNTKHRLLEEQIASQKVLHEKNGKMLSEININIVEMNKSLKRIARQQEKQTDLLKIKMNNKAKYELEKTKRHATNLELKKLKLEILENSNNTRKSTDHKENGLFFNYVS